MMMMMMSVKKKKSLRRRLKMKALKARQFFLHRLVRLQLRPLPST